jgi:hypothetical protein
MNITAIRNVSGAEISSGDIALLIARHLLPKEHGNEY